MPEREGGFSPEAEQPFRTSAEAQAQQPAELATKSARPLVGKRANLLVRPLRDRLKKLNDEDDTNATPLQYGYGVAEFETRRVFREIDSQGRLHLVDEVMADKIDQVIGYTIEAAETGFIWPGEFPGNIREDGGLIFAGRFSGTGQFGNLPPTGSQIRFFDSTQDQADPDLVAQTSLTDRFIGRGRSYVWSRWVFADGRFDGDPEVRVIAKSRACVDPRSSTSNGTFAGATKSFSFNPYVQIFDYLVRPEILGGAELPFDLIDIEAFSESAPWAEGLVDSVQYSRTAVFSTRSNQNSGTPPINTNHLLEFEESVVPFDYGDVVRVVGAPGQTLPANLSSNQDYHVVPIRYAVNVFQLPAIALADSLENALAGITVPMGTVTTDFTVTKVKEVRYQSGFTYRSGDNVLESMLRSCGAQLYLNAGKLSITSAQFPDSVVNLSIDELIGGLSLSTSTENTEDRVTELRGRYKGLTTLFSDRDFPAVNGGGLYVAQDARFKSGDYDLPYVPKPTIAQRLTEVELRKRRQELSLALSGDLSMYRAKPGSVVSVDFPKYNLDDQTTFQVVTQTVFVRVQSGQPFVGVNLETRQLESETFDLDLSIQKFLDNVKVPGLQSPFDVPPPGRLEIKEELYQTRKGAGVRSRAILSWPASTGLFVTGYEIKFKLSSQPTFTTRSVTPDTTQVIDDLQPGFYDFQVVAVNSANARSDPSLSQRLNFQIFGKAARPSAPTNFEGQVIGAATVRLRWDRTQDLDVLEGGFIEIRHSPLITGAEVANSVFLDSDVGGKSGTAIPFKQGTYFLRFEDSTGQFSEAASWSTQSRRPVALAQLPTGVGGALQDAANGNIFTIQEDSTFPSTNPGNTLVFDTDHLELPLEDTFDDEPDVDAILDIDSVGGGSVSPSGVYFFSTDVETDTPADILVESVIETELFDLSASLDDEPDFDQIPNVDQVAAALLQPGLAEAKIQVRFSDDPVASDTFGPWETIDTQIIRARSFQFRILASTTSTTANIRVLQARVRMRLVPT